VGWNPVPGNKAPSRLKLRSALGLCLIAPGRSSLPEGWDPHCQSSQEEHAWAFVLEVTAKARTELRQKQYENRSSLPLAEIQIGQDVYIQDHTGRKRWNRKGTVTGKDEGRGYTLITEDGTETARNRSHIMPVPVDCPTQDSDACHNLISDDSPLPAKIHEDLEVNQDCQPANSAVPDPANAPPRKSHQARTPSLRQVQ